MRTTLKSALTGALVAAATLAGTASLAGSDRPILRLMPMPGITPQITPGVRDTLRDALRPACVDLAVFADQRRLSGNRVRITYGVRNISSVDYVSGANQQSITLARGSRALSNGRFARLNAGQSLSWTVIVPTPFEFPDTYTARYAIDPDIFQDGNAMNDDCNRRNNTRRITVSS